MSGRPGSPPALGWLWEAFERGLAQNADGPAVCDGERQLSYRELDALITRMAAALADMNVSQGERVAVWLPKSIDAIAAMQAALRVGAAYVPVDPLSPIERVRRVLRDCQPSVCVALVAEAARLHDGDGGRMGLLTAPRLGGEWRPQRRAARARPGHADEAAVHGGDTAAARLAYILYTSGSTGVPKGVCISHANALAFIQWAHSELAPHSDDRFANHAPLHFDLSVLDIYVAFLAGACVCAIPETLSFIPARLVDLVNRERITVWYSVPSALMLMERAGLLDPPPSSLRAVLFAGEPFPIAPLRRLREALPDVRLLNLYGPTETNVCTFHEVYEISDHVDRPVPIGRACCGDEVWIEDDQRRRLPVGACGELLVAGPTVMLGYWGAESQRGPYRTGDIVQRISDSVYRYVGRRDAMVKVRGYRVELGEVEAAVAAHEDVLEAAVLAVGAGPESRLVAVVVPRAGATPDLLSIKRWCAMRLPRYMLIHALELRAELPRNRNGKLDRRELAASLQPQRALT